MGVAAHEGHIGQRGDEETHGAHHPGWVVQAGQDPDPVQDHGAVAENDLRRSRLGKALAALVAGGAAKLDAQVAGGIPHRVDIPVPHLPVEGWQDGFAASILGRWCYVHLRIVLQRPNAQGVHIELIDLATLGLLHFQPAQLHEVHILFASLRRQWKLLAAQAVDDEPRGVLAPREEQQDDDPEKHGCHISHLHPPQ